MTTLRVSWDRKLRVLDFDIENRPLSYAGQDFTFSEVTAVAWAWADKPREIESHVLGEEEPEGILLSWRNAYDSADLVTGHNIIRHDLPILNGALLELGLPGLGPKLVCDTYGHLKRRRGVSASQESLAAMLGVPAPKVHMAQADWREANRLTKPGLVKTRTRVESDVRQHLQLRARLLELQWLRNPRVWRP